MWLTLDIGNSAIKGAFFYDNKLLSSWSISYAMNWQQQFEARLQDHTITRAGICSVVPEHTRQIRETLSPIPILSIHSGLCVPLTIAYETPDTLGSDRLAAAVGAWHMYGTHGRNIVVIDAGTTVTYEVIDTSGVYRGGAIGCSPHMLSQALARGTSQLPLIEPTLPDSIIGRSTREALRAGVMAGFVDQVRGMLQRISQELMEDPIIIATGGWHTFLKKQLNTIHHIVPHLVHRGIYVLLTLNPTTLQSLQTTPKHLA